MSVLVLTTEPQRPASSAACRHNRLKLERPIAEKLLGGSNVNFATQAPTPPNHFSPITLFTKNQSRRAFGTSRTLGPFLGLTLKPHSSGWLARSRLSSPLSSCRSLFMSSSGKLQDLRAPMETKVRGRTGATHRYVSVAKLCSQNQKSPN